jgi:cytochrome c-type biogenesis protein CcmH
MNALPTVVLWLVLGCAPLWAQDESSSQLPAPAPSTALLDVPPAGPPVTDPAIAAQRAGAIADGLSCPVCQGLSAAASQAESAVAMRTRAQELVARGYSDAQVYDYFVSRYGEWILLEPPRHGRHWLVWLGPMLLLFIGALVVAWRMTANTKAPRGLCDPRSGSDPYERAVLDELDRS